MKKIYGVIIAFFLLFIPITKNDIVFASDSGIKKFYMDATILENGDIRVKELFSLNGDYNGFDRIIRYRNSESAVFNPNSEAFGGSSIHNGSGITLRKIGAINNYFSFADFDNSDTIEAFTEGTSSYGHYEQTIGNEMESYRIYNSSYNKKAFYVEYDLENMAILHNDIAEIGWNIFSDVLTEDIGEFELLIHLPNNQNELRGWAHGPLNGNIELIDKQTVKVTVKNLSSRTAMDVRLAFDKSVVSSSTKLTNVDALSKILVYEQEKANEANHARNVARIKYYGIFVIAVMWVIGLVILLLRTYYKYDKEYKSSFTGKYYREFPNDYSPELVGYLMNKKVEPDDLSASVLNLIYRKVISADKVLGGKKEDYELTYHSDKVEQANLTIAETKLIGWLFQTKEKIKLSEFKSNAKKGYESFLSSYNDWKNTVIADGEKHNFYEKTSQYKVFPIIYTIVGMVLCFILFNMLSEMLPLLICLVFGTFAINYFAAYTKRTKTGNEDYTKWKAFKNFLVDFGNFSQKELPEIVLWEKYLVYAVTLGCASKLAKTMEVKASEYYPNMDVYYPGYNFYFMMSISSSVNTGVNSAVSSAISTKAAAQSSNSSGSGFGGGFSGGGGSFGGGGGGGRF